MAITAMPAMKANSTFVSLDAEKLHFLPGRTEGRPFRYLTHFSLRPSRSARRDYTLSKREALWLGTEGDELPEAKLEKNSSTLFTTETRVVRKNRSAGVSPASEPRQLLLGQHDLCRLEAGDTFFLTTMEYTNARRTR